MADGPEQRAAERDEQFCDLERELELAERRAEEARDNWIEREMERDYRQALAFGQALDSIYACFEPRQSIKDEVRAAYEAMS